MQNSPTKSRVEDNDKETIERMRAKLGNREWRLDNLYWIKNTEGEIVVFKRNDAQIAYWRNMWFRNIILKARQLGFSTLIEIVQLDNCVFNSNVTAGLIDFRLEDAQDKIAKCRLAYERLPEMVKEKVELTKDSASALEFSNGSALQAGVSHVGRTLQTLHVSELGRISAEFPDKASEIKTGAFPTVHAGQLIHVESTPKGTGGVFADMVKQAEDKQKEGRVLSPLDFKLHFFAWWRNKSYRLTTPVPVPAELEEYFQELEGKHGIALDLFQRWWYAGMLSTLGPDDIKSEYPSTPEECFFASLEGAFFRRELSKARLEGRIGQPVPYDNSRPVNTFWDIGMDDATAIWFHQTDGVRHRFIDYYENDNESVTHYAKVLKDKADALDYVYGMHYMPHDIEVREWGSSNAKPRLEIAKENGIKPIDVGVKVADKQDAIEAARRFINLSWFDVKRCARGVLCLDNFRKEWDEKRGVWRARHLHDWASHAADALMTGTLAFVPEPPEEKDRRRSLQPPPRTTSWSA